MISGLPPFPPVGPIATGPVDHGHCMASTSAIPIELRVAELFMELLALNLHWQARAQGQEIRALGQQSQVSSQTATHMRWFAALSATFSVLGGAGAGASQLFGQSLSEDTRKLVQSLCLNVLAGFAGPANQLGEAGRKSLEMANVLARHDQESAQSARGSHEQIARMIPDILRTWPVRVPVSA